MANETIPGGITITPEDVLYRQFEMPAEMASPGAVGKDSYGPYHLSADQLRNMQDAPEFTTWKEQFQDLTPATAGFDAAWTKAGEQDPLRFEWAQNNYVDRTVVEPQRELLREETGLEIDGRSQAVRNVFFAGALADGPESDAMRSALQSRASDLGLENVSAMTDSQVLETIVDDRAQRDPSQADTLTRELGAAQDMLQGEMAAPQGGLEVPFEVSETYVREQVVENLVSGAVAGAAADPLQAALGELEKGAAKEARPEPRPDVHKAVEDVNTLGWMPGRGI